VKQKVAFNESPWRELMKRAGQHVFHSFDGGVICSGELLKVDNGSELTFEIEGKRITRGAGMSFSAASFDNGITSIDVRGLKRIVFLDTGSKTVKVEAGVTIQRLLDFLIANGFYFPVLPGYPAITIGGCIAANVHGKNPLNDSTILNRIESFTLHHVDFGEIEVSKSSHSELFDLTIGGCGLTGTILSVTLRVSPLSNRLVRVSVEPIPDICDLPGILTNSEGNDFIVSWHDFNQTGGRFGSGFIERGEIIPPSCDSDLSSSQELILPVKEPHRNDSIMTLRAESRGQNFPSLWSQLTLVGAMNSVYTSIQSWRCGSPRLMRIEDCIFPNKNLRDLYFHGFGKRGLFEHQIILGIGAFPEYIERVRWWLSRNELPITMASGKGFSGETRYLRFSKDGICFALDFPRCEQGKRFLSYLDAIVIKLGAIPNIFKDSRLPPEVVAKTYPDYELFQERLREFDPKRRYCSELSVRLEL